MCVNKSTDDGKTDCVTLLLLLVVVGVMVGVAVDVAVEEGQSATLVGSGVFVVELSLVLKSKYWLRMSGEIAGRKDDRE